MLIADQPGCRNGIGPAQDFRLIYTNGENNFELLPNNLGFGTYINGLSRTFVQDCVLAQGRNVFSISVGRPRAAGGMVITFDYPSQTSDYALIAFSSNQQPLGSGQSHAPDSSDLLMFNTDVNVAQGDGCILLFKK